MGKLTDLATLAKTSVVDADYLLVTNSTSGSSKKITVSSMFPAVSTAGTSSETLYNSATLTNKNQIVFKGIKSGDTDLLTVTTDSSNIVLTALEAGIDLSLCNNTTSGFLSGVDFTGIITGECPVIRGGTGLSTIAKGSVLYASDTDVITAATPATNGHILVHNSTTGVPAWAALSAGTNLTLDVSSAGILKLDANLGTLAADLDMANFNLKLGTGWISTNATDQGIKVTAANTYLGASGNHHDTDILNLGGGGIALGKDTDATIKINDTTSTTVGKDLTIQAGGSDNATAGDLFLKAGDAGSGNNAGGDIKLYGGNDYGSGVPGDIEVHTYNAEGATVKALTINGGAGAQNVTADAGHLVVRIGNKGIVHAGSGVVTQGTSGTPNYATGVTLDTTSGIITLDSNETLASGAFEEFVVTNSAVQQEAVILLQVQSLAEGSETADSSLIAYTNTIADGSFNILLQNGSDATLAAGARKIHFLVINPAVS